MAHRVASKRKVVLTFGRSERQTALRLDAVPAVERERGHRSVDVRTRSRVHGPPPRRSTDALLGLAPANQAARVAEPSELDDTLARLTASQQAAVVLVVRELTVPYGNAKGRTSGKVPARRTRAKSTRASRRARRRPPIVRGRPRTLACALLPWDFPARRRGTALAVQAA